MLPRRRSRRDRDDRRAGSRHAATALFGEGAGGFVVSGSRAALEGLATRVLVIGEVGGGQLAIDAAGARVAVSLDALSEAHGALARLL